MDEDVVATFNYNLAALKLEFKTTCDALETGQKEQQRTGLLAAQETGSSGL